MAKINILIEGIPLDRFFDWNHQNDKFIELIVTNNKNSEIIRIFGQRHSPIKVKEWIRESRDAIMVEEPPDFLKVKKSLAKSIDDFYERSTTSELENHGDAILRYRQSHDLRFAFRGTDIPMTIIAKAGKEYTISTSGANNFLFFLDELKSKEFLYAV